MAPIISFRHMRVSYCPSSSEAAMQLWIALANESQTTSVSFLDHGI